MVSASGEKGGGAFVRGGLSQGAKVAAAFSSPYKHGWVRYSLCGGCAQSRATGAGANIVLSFIKDKDLVTSLHVSFSSRRGSTCTVRYDPS